MEKNDLWFFLCIFIQKRIQRCSTGPVGIEDSADGSAMPRSTSLVTMGALEDTGRHKNPHRRTVVATSDIYIHQNKLTYSKKT